MIVELEHLLSQIELHMDKNHKAKQIPFSLQSQYFAHYYLCHSKRNHPTQMFLAFADQVAKCHQPEQVFLALLVQLAARLASLVAAENLVTVKSEKLVKKYPTREKKFEIV
jgi:hypothetical protein